MILSIKHCLTVKKFSINLKNLCYIFQGLNFGDGLKILPVGPYTNSWKFDLPNGGFIEISVQDFESSGIDINKSSENDRHLGEHVQNLWISFINGSQPHSDGIIWPEYHKNAEIFKISSSRFNTNKIIDENDKNNINRRMLFTKYLKKDLYLKNFVRKIEKPIERPSLENPIILPKIKTHKRKVCQENQISVNGVCYTGVKKQLDQIYIESFLGVPYARAERFEHAQGIQEKDDRVADNPGPYCYQKESCGFENLNENCLNLNIFRRVDNIKNKTVMVYRDLFFEYVLNSV